MGDRGIFWLVEHSGYKSFRLTALSCKDPSRGTRKKCRKKDTFSGWPGKMIYSINGLPHDSGFYIAMMAFCCAPVYFICLNKEQAVLTWFDAACFMGKRRIAAAICIDLKKINSCCF